MSVERISRIVEIDGLDLLRIYPDVESHVLEMVVGYASAYLSSVAVPVLYGYAVKVYPGSVYVERAGCSVFHIRICHPESGIRQTCVLASDSHAAYGTCGGDFSGHISSSTGKYVFQERTGIAKGQHVQCGFHVEFF